MTLQQAKENIGKKILYSIDNEQKEGIIISVGMHVFVKFDDIDYYKSVEHERIELIGE